MQEKRMTCESWRTDDFPAAQLVLLINQTFNIPRSSSITDVKNVRKVKPVQIKLKWFIQGVPGIQGVLGGNQSAATGSRIGNNGTKCKSCSVAASSKALQDSCCLYLCAQNISAFLSKIKAVFFANASLLSCILTCYGFTTDYCFKTSRLADKVV